MNGWVTPLTDSSVKGAACYVPATLDQSIAQNIRAAILTRRGERPLSPTFGSRVHEFFFRLLDSTLMAELENHLTAVIAQAEPRIAVREVEIERVKNEEGEIRFLARYEITQLQRMGEFRMAVRP